MVGLAVARAQLQQVQAQLDIAKLNLERAPAGGLISARNGQIGANATSGGEPINRLIKGGDVETGAEVIEDALVQITTGDLAELTVAGVGDVSGIVRRIAPTVDLVNRLGLTLIDPDSQTGLRSGAFANGWIIIENRTSLAVPTSAVWTESTGPFVLVIKDVILETCPIVAGLIWNDLREIACGANDNVLVVVKAVSFFGAGDRINPIFPDKGVTEGIPK